MEFIKKELDVQFIKEWMKKGLDPILLSILNRRGYENESDLFDIYAPVFEELPSPFLFKDIDKAYNRILKAIKKNEKIIIYGDGDVDGTTSTAILYKFLNSMTKNVYWDVPIGDDPYGINRNKIDLWAEKDFKLCITVDCGISNIEEVEDLTNKGIDTIIIDHHQPPSELPKACAIINPKAETNFIFNELAACGVTFLFIFGFLFFKSDLYNKTVTLFYKEDIKLKSLDYKNLMISRSSDKNIKNSENLNSFIYMENVTEEDLKTIKGTNTIKLKPITDIYKNDYFYLIDKNKIKSKISLFNNLFSNIKDLETIKKDFLPLVALGSIADIVALVKSNRILSKLGIQYIKTSPPENIYELCKEKNIEPKNISTKDISWGLCPVLNAPGRMKKANLTVNFLLNNKDDNKTSMKEILALNEERKKNGDKAYKKFFETIDNTKSNYNNNLAFFFSEDILSGVTGITATKLLKLTNCPTIVAAKEGEFYIGSIRGKSEMHFVDFLDKGAEILSQYGGHKEAAGFRFHEDNLSKFIDFLENSSILFENDSNKNNSKIIIDAEIPINFLDFNLYSIIDKLEPFGMENQNPIFFTPNIKIHSFSKIGKDKNHLKVFFKTNKRPFVGLYWDKGEWFENIYEDLENEFDVIYQIETNRFNGQYLLQMMILDIQRSNA